MTKDLSLKIRLDNKIKEYNDYVLESVSLIERLLQDQNTSATVCSDTARLCKEHLKTLRNQIGLLTSRCMYDRIPVSDFALECVKEMRGV